VNIKSQVHHQQSWHLVVYTILAYLENWLKLTLSPSIGNNIFCYSGGFNPLSSPSLFPKYTTSGASRDTVHKLKPKVISTYLPHSQIAH